MPEHVFLCGLTKEQRTEFPPGQTLSLEKRAGNLKLELERLRRRLLGAEPRRLTDLIEIASYVFAADRTTSRGPLTDPGVGVQWRREFCIVVAVRDLEFWQQQSVNENLAEALGFLSEDVWRFEFVANCHPIPLNEFLALEHQEADASGGTSIVLFSGGLDSLAGAVHELRHTNRHVVLVSHRNLPGIGSRQQKLASQLADAYPRRVTHVSVDHSLTSKLRDREETQRTRSFFFAAMAAVAAHIEEADRIRFYENGVMSVNLPIATQALGARSSRSTHPRSLQLLGRVIDMIALHPISIDNPFIWITKAEVVKELAMSPQAGLITTSVSCTRARTANSIHKPHCGTCVQCLQRRISTLTGGAAEFDEQEGYEADFLKALRKDGIDRAMALGTIELALDCAAISDRDFMGRFAGPVSWVLLPFAATERDDAAKKIIDLYQRYGRTVRDLLIEAAKPVLPDVIDGTLPPESLLALALASRLPTVNPPAIGIEPERLPEPPPDEASATGIAESVAIAIDERRQRILIQDQAELSGSAIFPLMKLLIEVFLKERSKPGRPQSYRSLRARKIADELGLSDEEAVRAAVGRARAELEVACIGLGLNVDPNAVIETTKAGYRLNPNVTVVTLEQINRR